MAWNKRETKGLNQAPEAKVLSPGAPIVYMPGKTDQPYKDNWDVQRAFEEGVRRVTWSFRAIDAIAGNQARLPMILRKDNDPHGQVVRKNDLLTILNSKTNEGENSFIFRYRLSSQLLLSTRGVFIEVIRGNGGQPVSLHLLPPEITAPVPDPKTFVKHFEVELGNGEKKKISPKDVIWLRRPHPLDPYLSLTPLEAAGLAVETETLARIYNRNFLLNDGRGGAMLILNGELNEDDRRELIARHSGGPGKAGSFSVIAAEDGAEYFDLGTNPREAGYAELRQITKEEILAAFGVPESIIGNASGRTFANAAEEGKIFWMETMAPHLEIIARGMDELDEQYYVGFDTSKVPILELAEQERNRFLMDEFTSGLTSANEYRDGTGRKAVKSDLADSLLINPNLTSIGNTKKRMDPFVQNPALANAPLDVQSGETPILEFPEGTPEDGSAAQQLADDPNVPNFDQFEAAAAAQDEIRTKALDDMLTKAEAETERWETILGSTLDRFFDRQERVIKEKVNGKKAQAALAAGTLTLAAIFNSETWQKQLTDDLRPVIQGIVLDSMEDIGKKTGLEVSVEEDDVQEYIDAQTKQAQYINEQVAKDLAAAILVANGTENDDDEAPLIKAALLTTIIANIYLKSRKERRLRIAQEEALTSYNAGVYFGGKQTGTLMKVWITRDDASVREAHKHLHGKKAKMTEGFTVGDAVLRFPKDPLAPPNLTVNCRCTLGFTNEE